MSTYRIRTAIAAAAIGVASFGAAAIGVHAATAVALDPVEPWPANTDGADDPPVYYYSCHDVLGRASDGTQMDANDVGLIRLLCFPRWLQA